MSKLAAASLAIDARLAGMQDAIRDVLDAVDGCAAWDVTLAKIDALRLFVPGHPLSDRPLSIIPPKLVIDPAPSGLRIVPPAACNLCSPVEVCGVCAAAMNAPRPTRESERAMRRLAEAAVAWHGLRDDDLEGEIMPRPEMAEACAVEVEAFSCGCSGTQSRCPIHHDGRRLSHPPADATDAYTMDGSKFCTFCGLPSHGSRLCDGRAAEQSSL